MKSNIRPWTWSPERLREIREKKVLSMSQLATRVSEFSSAPVQKQMVDRWEKGSAPNAANLMALCSALRVDPWALSEE